MSVILTPDRATLHFKLPSRGKALALAPFKVRFTDFLHKSLFTKAS